MYSFKEDENKFETLFQFFILLMGVIVVGILGYGFLRVYDVKDLPFIEAVPATIVFVLLLCSIVYFIKYMSKKEYNDREKMILINYSIIFAIHIFISTMFLVTSSFEFIPFYVPFLFFFVSIFFVWGILIYLHHALSSTEMSKLTKGIFKNIVFLFLVLLFFSMVVFVPLFLWDYYKPKIIIKKPAIYVYPLHDQHINVSLDIINGHITYSEPLYRDGRWNNLFVKRDGTIDNKYSYLYYECSISKLKEPERGWLVEYTNLKSWFDEYLRKYNLNDKEIRDFEQYWLNTLPKSRYYLIKPFDEKYLDRYVKLNVSPRPDTLIRVIFYFEPIDHRVNILPPKINRKERKGFVVVEWGGTVGQ